MNLKNTWNKLLLDSACEIAWDVWCLLSVIGIWPRFIEPRLLKIRRLILPIEQLPANLAGLKILHMTDLHWSGHFPLHFQKKVIRKANSLQPDLILFTGDFLCRSKLDNPERLSFFLNSLHAVYGCFAVLGNHDYKRYITINDKGEYALESSSKSDIIKGFHRLFHPVHLTGKVTDLAAQVEYHEKLLKFLKGTPFQLLKNETVQLPCKGSKINICGLEEYMAGRFNPKIAFKDYDSRYLGIILSHNPDTIPLLKNWPGELILSGHTHGGQVNLPFLWKRFIQIEHLQYKRGLHALEGKWANISSGISSVLKFRWRAMPELTLLTLQGKQT